MKDFFLSIQNQQNVTTINLDGKIVTVSFRFTSFAYSRLRIVLFFAKPKFELIGFDAGT